MRLCLPARMGGGGKAESTPWSGPAGAQRPPHGGNYSASGNERAKPLAFPLNKETEAISLPQPQRGIQTAPSHGATQTGGVAASEAGTRLLSQKDSAASARESAPVARPARREARVPAGQPTDSAPSRSAAGKSATLEIPAHLEALAPFTLLIVTGTAKTTGLGSLKRIERVAVRQRPISGLSNDLLGPSSDLITAFFDRL